MPQQNLYSNTLMVVLNARRNWSEALYERSLVSDVSSYTLLMGVPPDSPYIAAVQSGKLNFLSEENAGRQ